MKFGSLPRSRFAIPKLTRGGAFNPAKDPEPPLSGTVQNEKAAQGEERLARTLDKSIRKGLVRGYQFRWTTMRRGVVGYKELDFLIQKTSGEYVPVSVKGKAFVHRNVGDKEQDRINELIIITKLRDYGINASKVTTIFDTDLETQEQADNTARKNGLYR